MPHKVIFQTLENRDNPDLIERDGPFSCKWDNTWLGEGYYYWDTFIQIAHWWGNIRYNNKHIICQADCDFDTEKCFDLVGSTEHLCIFSDSLDKLKGRGLLTNKTTVARVLHHMRKTLKIFHYEAIRVYGIDSVSKHKNPEFSYRIIFEHNRFQYLDYKPAIQICIYNKYGLNLKNYKIIFPDEYNSDYVI